MSEFSKKVMIFFKEKREALGFTQAHVAENIYGDKKYRCRISALESGKKFASTRTIQKLLDFFNCEFETFKEN